MKTLRDVLYIALAFAIMSTVVLAGTIHMVDAPPEPRPRREIVVDYGVDGNPNSEQVYIEPYQIGPGKYIYAYADEYSKVFSYRNDSQQQSGEQWATLP